MKTQLTLFCTLFALTCLAQNFEGTIKWKVTSEVTDSTMKAKMDEGQKRMNDPAMQAQMKQMEERMKDPQFKAMMEKNPQMKTQMENMMKMKSAGPTAMIPSGITVQTKNGNARTMIEGGMMAGTETLYLKEKNQTIMINTQSKTYSIMTSTPGAGGPNVETKVTRTSETQKILNYTCTKVIATHTMGQNSMEQIFWVTNEIKGFDMKGLSSQRMSGPSLPFEKLDGVPLKMELTTPQSKMVMEVTEIKKETLAKTVFEIPAGFTETKTPGMH